MKISPVSHVRLTSVSSLPVKIKSLVFTEVLLWNNSCMREETQFFMLKKERSGATWY